MNYPAVIQNPLLQKLKSKPDVTESKTPWLTPRFRNFFELGAPTNCSSLEVSEALHWTSRTEDQQFNSCRTQRGGQGRGTFLINHQVANDRSEAGEGASS
jgi:hypothetical protein